MSQPQLNTALTPEEEVHMVQEWLCGKDDGIRRSYGTIPEKGSKWYIISMSWYKRWKIFMGITEESDMEIDQPLGPIDNSDVVSTDPILKPANSKDYNS